MSDDLAGTRPKRPTPIPLGDLADQGGAEGVAGRAGEFAVLAGEVVADEVGAAAAIELGLARGKHLHDRRRDIADRDAKRDIARELADVQRGR